MKPIEVPIGSTFKFLTLVEHLPSENKRRHALFECKCGVVKNILLQNVTRKLTKSCGCLVSISSSKAHRTHGFAGGTNGIGRRSEYRIWSLMIQRCENIKNPAYDRYGGREISVCDRWHKFENFLADMGPRPSTLLSLDRINNDGNYEPSNCRWATRSEQMKNRRMSLRDRNTNGRFI